MNVIGISSYFHDSAVALIKDGNIVCALQEERFSRIKHDPRFPALALARLVKDFNLIASDIDAVVFFDKPLLKFERILESVIDEFPKGVKTFAQALPIWASEKLFVKSSIKREFKKIGILISNEKIFFSEHHLSHAASAFYPSPFENAAILTLDGVGEWTTTSLSYGHENKIDILKEISFPDSLGLLYSAFTYYCGFRVNSGEYKLMGLAPYGNPIYAAKIKDNLIELRRDGSFSINMSYFDYKVGDRMINDNFRKLFNSPERGFETENISQFYMDIAASIQAVTEEAMLGLAQSAKIETGSSNLCLAGGVALNCVGNGKIEQANIFDNIWIQPAAGDAGGAIGAALAFYYDNSTNRRSVSKQDSNKGALLGNRYSNDQIDLSLSKLGAHTHFLEDEEMIEFISQKISEGQAIGWFQGRMEFGPRALGARSILGDPRSAETQKVLNLKVKFRESFRPFAPAVLAEEAQNWFDTTSNSPYMLLVSPIKLEHRCKTEKKIGRQDGIDRVNEVRSSVPAITHIDYSARLQTVHKETNPLFYRLLFRFFEKTGVPMVVNTSFNVRGEPIVESPEDAFKCFMGTDLDFLSIGNFALEKDLQDPKLLKKYHHRFNLD